MLKGILPPAHAGWTESLRTDPRFHGDASQSSRHTQSKEPGVPTAC